MRKLFLLVLLLPLLGMGLFAADSILLRLGDEAFGPIETAWLFGALAIAVASILISLLAARTTTASLQRIRTTIETITTEPRAPHDTLEGHDDDETGRLAIAVNGLAEYLDGLDRRLGASAAELHDSARLITDGGTQWSRRSDAQLSRLEQTAAGMARMAAVIRENAAHVGAADRIATEAMSQAKAGGDVLARAIRAMSEIDAASGQIADIVRVIDEIAFQTNLLALNAAVEAARAGESGRGFAIVAGEVRSLSQRSAGAAREIRALIGDTTAKIEQGTALVNESGEVLHGIITDVKQMGDIVGDITATTREQSAGIEQACRMLRQIGTMGQENNALLEQIALVGRSMHEHADVLDDLVRHFDRIPDLRAPLTPQVMPEFEAPPDAAPKPGPEPAGHSVGHRREPFIERRKADRPWSDTPARERRE